jgi:hypothetical protein
MHLHKQPLFRTVFLGACFGAVLGIAPVRAEMLQFATPDGEKSWPKLPDIPEWHQDQETSMRAGANALVPDGMDPANAEVTIQARGFPRRGEAAVTSISQLTEKDQAAVPPGTQIKPLANVADKDGTPFNLYAFAPAPGSNGPWKAAAYSEEGDYLLAFTLTARSQAVYDRNLPVFTGLIRKYAREIPW